MEFRDVLRDLVATTTPIGFETIIVAKEDRGQGEKVYLESHTLDREVVMRAYVKDDVTDMTDSFGLGSLPMLQGLLGLNSYRTDGTKIVPVETNGVTTKLVFKSETANTDFLVMEKSYLPKQPKFTDSNYDITLIPVTEKVNELKSFAGVFKTISPLVTPYTEDGILCFKVGSMNKNVHTGSLTFSECTGTLKVTYGFPVERILQTLSRVNNANSVEMNISAKGVLNIKLDTGVAVYDFYMMGR